MQIPTSRAQRSLSHQPPSPFIQGHRAAVWSPCSGSCRSVPVIGQWSVWCQRLGFPKTRHRLTASLPLNGKLGCCEGGMERVKVLIQTRPGFELWLCHLAVRSWASYLVSLSLQKQLVTPSQYWSSASAVKLRAAHIHAKTTSPSHVDITVKGIDGMYIIQPHQGVLVAFLTCFNNPP